MLRLLVFAASTTAGLGACGPQVPGVTTDTGTSETPPTETTMAGTTEEPSVESSTGSTTSSSTTGIADDSTSGTTASPIVCGNGLLEPGEQCDGTNHGDATCLSLFGYPGELACTEACVLDLLGCVPPGMILIPAGEFEMGSNTHSIDELPARQVNVDGFYIDIDEVTVADYGECVDAGDCNAPGFGGACNWAVPGREDHPLNCVSWTDANSYCSFFAGIPFPKRLPTEAEWEKAARSDDARLYPWGEEPPPSCTHVSMDEGAGGGCGAGSSIPVGSKPLGDSPYGVHDMSGGVWDWTADWYAPYDVAETDNPTGPPTGMLKVMRGGGWVTSDPDWFRTSARIGQRTTNVNINVGFRCAQDLVTLEE